MGLNVGGFLSIVVDRLLKEPPPKTEPYTPPDEDIPPSPYIPLALRLHQAGSDADESPDLTSPSPLSASFRSHSWCAP
jgi:hypothetical protein